MNPTRTAKSSTRARPIPTIITIVEVPEGYSEDYNDDVYTEKYSCSVTVVIEKE